jgi:hypothetical protein
MAFACGELSCGWEVGGMSIRDELEKMIGLERQRLEEKARVKQDFERQQFKRFQPLKKLLLELQDSIDKPYRVFPPFDSQINVSV